jgi:type IX secretion system PorP/SprF family membrane protein
MKLTMKRYINKFIVLFLIFTGTTLYAQQQNSYTFYRQNMNIVNPAYAGADGNTTFAGIFRSQWSGVKNAPEAQAFSFGTYSGKRVGVGLSVENDRTFVEQQTFVTADFSYRLPMNEQLDLFLGLKAGGNFYNVNTSELETWNYEVDPSLVGLSRFNPNVGVGAYLKHEKYYISLSAPKILETKRAREEEGIVTTAADRVHMYLSGGYDFRLNSTLELKPSVMLRYVDGAPVSVDFTALMNIHNNFEVGAAYRTDEAISGLALIKVIDWFDFGYAYESSLRSELQNVSNGTHELFVRFTLKD